jgi:starch-binding outer membrane protein, SusD/RagB family
MAKTMFTGTVTFENGFTSNEFTQTTTGYNFYKDIEGTDAQNIYNNLNGSDWPAMRYAEVLLMYAEAANEADGPGPAVYDAIDQIRNRADVLMPPLAPGLSQTQMRAAIRHERRIELAFEGFRYEDLKRWKIAPQALTLPASESIRSKSFIDKNYHLPLPQSEIDINRGVLVQNPDY